MIRVNIYIDHPHGAIEVTETEEHTGSSEEAVTNHLKRVAARAETRARCAVTAKEAE